MKKIFILLALINFSVFSVFCQNWLSIDTVEVIPFNPDTNAVIQIRTEITSSTFIPKFYDSVFVSGNLIKIIICVNSTNQFTYRTFKDTFTIGKLPVGNYTVNVQAYGTYSSSECIPYDTTMKELTFDVTFPTSTRKKLTAGNNSVSLYPNPSPAHQTLVVNIEKPQQLDITLHDVAGRAVKYVYFGKAVPGEHHYQVNINNLVPGIYIYKIMAGNEVLHILTVKS
jgi:hypothetical protein